MPQFNCWDRFTDQLGMLSLDPIYNPFPSSKWNFQKKNSEVEEIKNRINKKNKFSHLNRKKLSLPIYRVGKSHLRNKEELEVILKNKSLDKVQLLANFVGNLILNFQTRMLQISICGRNVPCWLHARSVLKQQKLPNQDPIYLKNVKIEENSKSAQDVKNLYKQLTISDTHKKCLAYRLNLSQQLIDATFVIRIFPQVNKDGFNTQLQMDVLIMKKLSDDDEEYYLSGEFNNMLINLNINIF